MGIAKALGLHRGEVERFKTLEVDIAFQMGTVITWSVRLCIWGFSVKNVCTWRS